jgi:hypothetical protein
VQLDSRSSSASRAAFDCVWVPGASALTAPA